MDPVELYHLLGRKPFKPVCVHLKDGRSYGILMREQVVVGVTYLDIGIQALGEAPGICEAVVTVPLNEISHVEPWSVLAPPVPG